MSRHHDAYDGLLSVTVTCTCGWVSQRNPSRGAARRAYETHLYRHQGRRADEQLAEGVRDVMLSIWNEIRAGR